VVFFLSSRITRLPQSRRSENRFQTARGHPPHHRDPKAAMARGPVFVSAHPSAASGRVRQTQTLRVHDQDPARRVAGGLRLAIAAAIRRRHVVAVAWRNHALRADEGGADIGCHALRQAQAVGRRRRGRRALRVNQALQGWRVRSGSSGRLLGAVLNGAACGGTCADTEQRTDRPAGASRAKS
jgi:hypothetical protein